MDTWKNISPKNGTESNGQPLSGDRRAPSESEASSIPRSISSQSDERWKQIMADFVDDPRGAVAAAHELVGQSVQAVIEALHAEHAALQEQWSRDSGDKEAATETLRMCLQQYRAFSNRLASGVVGTKLAS